MAEVILARGEFEWLVDADECGDDQQAAMDLVRERIAEAGGRVLHRVGDDAMSEELAALRALQPPADLPTTLASVDDVRRVCTHYGLRELGGGIWWSDDNRPLKVEVQRNAPRTRFYGIDLDVHTDDPDAHEDDEIVWSVSLDPGTPTTVFVAAIQAARSAS